MSDKLVLGRFSIGSSSDVLVRNNQILVVSECRNHAVQIYHASNHRQRLRLFQGQKFHATMFSTEQATLNLEETYPRNLLLPDDPERFIEVIVNARFNYQLCSDEKILKKAMIQLSTQSGCSIDQVDTYFKEEVRSTLEKVCTTISLCAFRERQCVELQKNIQKHVENRNLREELGIALVSVEVTNIQTEGDLEIPKPELPHLIYYGSLGLVSDCRLDRNTSGEFTPHLKLKENQVVIWGADPSQSRHGVEPHEVQEANSNERILIVDTTSHDRLIEVSVSRSLKDSNQQHQIVANLRVQYKVNPEIIGAVVFDDSTEFAERLSIRAFVKQLCEDYQRHLQEAPIWLFLEKLSLAAFLISGGKLAEEILGITISEVTVDDLRIEPPLLAKLTHHLQVVQRRFSVEHRFRKNGILELRVDVPEGRVRVGLRDWEFYPTEQPAIAYIRVIPTGEDNREKKAKNVMLEAVKSWNVESSTISLIVQEIEEKGINII